MIKDKTFSILTLGCKVNHYESESIIEKFIQNGYTLVGEQETAEIYVINTCTVTNLSDRKSRQYIRKAKRENNEAIVAVLGCYSQTNPKEVAAIPEVDIILGTKEKDSIVELCERFNVERSQINRVVNLDKLNVFENMDVSKQHSMTRAYMKVQDGCNQFCSYCIIPYARGNIRSRSIKDAVVEAKRLVDLGYKELILTGIHIGSYGKDLGNKRLVDLIEFIADIDGLERIRLSSIEPNIIDDDFMRRIIATNKVCDHFHLSLQNGSDEILKKMNRKYDSKLYYEKTEIIRKYMPYVGLTTDIIVGFPEESPADFEKTCDFANKVGFSKIHVFKYSPRKGTPAAKRKNQVSGEVKIQRSKELMEISNKLSEKFIDHNNFRELSVLFERKSKKADKYEGYSTNYIRIQADSRKDLKNIVKNVKIIGRENETAIAEIL